jgi:hypothetical protein
MDVIRLTMVVPKVGLPVWGESCCVMLKISPGSPNRVTRNSDRRQTNRTKKIETRLNGKVRRN